MGKHFSVAINNNAERNINNKSTQQQCTAHKGTATATNRASNGAGAGVRCAARTYNGCTRTHPANGGQPKLPSCRAAKLQSNKKSASTNKIKAINCNCSRQSDGHDAGAEKALDGELNGYWKGWIQCGKGEVKRKEEGRGRKGFLWKNQSFFALSLSLSLTLFCSVPLRL